MKCPQFQCLRGAVCAAVLAAVCASPAHAVIIDWVPVGNPGNANDGTGYGAVTHDYWISKHEVTNSQYVEFLNVKDPTGINTFDLYHGSMTSNSNGGIIYTAGNPNGSKYSVKSGRGNNPVNYVSWYDAIRFANWLHNGWSSGDTETGAYTLLGGTPTPSNDLSITRNTGAMIFLPSENEWYKAAYHQNDGLTGNYWDYPTGTNVEPNSDQPPGDPAIQSNIGNLFREDGLANGYNDGYAVTGSTSWYSSQNYLTEVGAYPYSPSPYGTFDQGGNVWEWNETLISGSQRGWRGGSWSTAPAYLLASGPNSNYPSYEDINVGFRVAMIPEPSSSTLALLAVIGLGCLRRRNR